MGKEENLSQLLERGRDIADLDFKDPLGRDLLHIAAAEGDVDALTWLVQRGLRPASSVVPTTGNTLVHTAVIEGQFGVLRSLEQLLQGGEGRRTSTPAVEQEEVSSGGGEGAREFTRLAKTENVEGWTAHQLVLEQEPSLAEDMRHLLLALERKALHCTGAQLQSTRHAAENEQDQGHGEADEEDVDGDDESDKAFTPHAPLGEPSALRGALAAHAADGGEGEVGEGTGAGGGGQARAKQEDMAQSGGPPSEMKSASEPAVPLPAAAPTSTPGVPVVSKSEKKQRRKKEEAEEDVCDFFLSGAWSKAGVATCLEVTHKRVKRLRVAFDIGVCPEQVAGCKHVFISHGHTDHCGAAVIHARMRSLTAQAPASYYAPPDVIAGLEAARVAFSAMNGSEIPMKFVPFLPGHARVSLGDGCFVQAFETKHRVASQGYAILQQKRMGLKEEYRGLDGQELRNLRKAGVSIEQSKEVVEVVYTGDTEMEALLEVDAVWKARLLLMELSYLTGDKSKAKQWQHIHLEDVLEQANRLAGVRELVLCHVSGRYGLQQILEILRSAFMPSQSLPPAPPPPPSPRLVADEEAQAAAAAAATAVGVGVAVGQGEGHSQAAGAESRGGGAEEQAEEREPPRCWPKVGVTLAMFGGEDGPTWL